MSIIEYLKTDTNRQFYSGESGTLWRLYFKQKTELAYADMLFVEKWEHQKDNIKVLFIHYLYVISILFIYYLYIIYIDDRDT